MWYRNVKTGAEFKTDSIISAEGYVAIEPIKPVAAKPTVKAEPKKEEPTEKPEVKKEAPTRKGKKK